MTPMQREELDMDIKHANDDGFRVLNVRQPRELPNWAVFVLWCVVWGLVGIVAVFAFDKLEGFARLKWPNL